MCIFAGILVGSYTASLAQTKTASIQGKVTTENNTNADLATVILLAADSAILKSTTCDISGIFRFEDIGPGKYLVLASKVGFAQSLGGPYVLDEKNALNIQLKLMRSYPQLKEVSVSAKKPYIDVRPGRVVLNVQSSIIAEGNSVFDILKQAPGVHVDNQGNMSIIGRQNALVMVDGKPTNLTAESLATYLQGMQSSSVQRIELISNPSAKYETSGAGIINIISKKGTTDGTNATVTIGGGWGTFYKSNSGVVINSRNENFNVFGSYTYSGDETFHSILTNRLINDNGLNSNYDADYYARQRRRNNNYRVGADYFISENSTLGFIIYGSANSNSFVKTNKLHIANNGVPDSVINTDSQLKRNLGDITYDINYSGVLDRSGKTLSADVLYNKINRQSDEYITNDFYNTSGAIYRAPLLLQNLSPSAIDYWIFKTDYTDPITKTLKMEAGIKYSRAKSDNNLVFGPLVNGQYQSDPNFSNNFIFTENINAGYVNFTNSFAKVNLVAGIRVEQTNSNGNSVTLHQTVNNSYLNIFPQLQVVYHHDPKNDFTLSFNRGIERPSYIDINPFLYYTDLYDYRAGNPNLLPQYSSNIQLSHSYNSTLVTTAYAHFITGFYGFNDFQQNDITKVNITIKRNFGSMSVYGIKFSAPVTFTSWWNANFNVDAAYDRIVAYKQYGDLNKGTQDIQAATTQSFTLSGTVTAELSAKYESPSFYGISHFKSYFQSDAGIAKQLFGKNATLKLSVADIFNTWRDRATSNYQNLDLSIIDKSETRVMRLNFIYRFGKLGVKVVKHQIANDEERKRASGN